MRELLTPALASANPKAYIAHFKRMDGDAQRSYLGQLAPDDLRTHFKTVGENATVGLFLKVSGGVQTLEATVAGSTLGSGSTTELVVLQNRALELGQLIEAKVISGMVTTTLGDIEATEAALRSLGWAVRAVIFAGDSGGGDVAPALGWSLRGVIGTTGTFYMPTEALRWEERGEIEPMLRALAARWDAQLDVRL